MPGDPGGGKHGGQSRATATQRTQSSTGGDMKKAKLSERQRKARLAKQSEAMIRARDKAIHDAPWRHKVKTPLPDLQWRQLDEGPSMPTQLGGRNPFSKHEQAMLQTPVDLGLV